MTNLFFLGYRGTPDIDAIRDRIIRIESPSPEW
jgi:hypothetical protein